MLREVEALAQGDTASSSRTGIQSHVHLTPHPLEFLWACFSVLSSASGLEMLGGSSRSFVTPGDLLSASPSFNTSAWD